MKKRIKSKKIVPAKTRVLKKSKHANFLIPLIVLGVIVLGSAIYYTIPRPTPVGINLVGNAAGTVDLSLSPSTVNLVPNQESTITLGISAGTSHATVAQVEIEYDSTKIGTPTVELGDFLSSAFIGIKTDNNKITFTAVAPTTSGGITGSGTLATIKVKPATVGTSTLTFTQNTIVAVAETDGQNINSLKSAIDATITVVAVTASADPSTPASADPSTPASADPSVAASPSLSPSPSPSAPAAAKPAKPTGLRSNCYDGGNKITLRWDAVSGVDSYKVRMDQKDGSNDKSNDGIKATEYSYDIIAGQKYSWWVHSTKDGADSEEAKINEVVCDKAVATATPTPTPTVKPTVKPTTKATATPKPTTTAKVTATPTSTATTQYTAKTNTTGSLNDIFADQNNVENSSDVTPANKNIWQKFLEWLSSLFIPSGN